MGFIADILIASVLGAAMWMGMGTATVSTNSAADSTADSDLGGAPLPNGR